MTTYPCPNGHASTADDYCDTCGAPITPAGAPDGPVGAGAGGSALPAASSPGPAPGGSAPAAPASGAVACPHCSTDNPAASLFCEACGYDFTTGTMPRPPDGDAAPGVLDLGPGDAAAGTPGSVPASPAPASPVPGPDAPQVAPPVPVQWVTEVWVDPDWYAAQESEETCPSPGLPAVVPLARQSVLVGRPSTSRGIHPDIDCSGDIGVSRRQAQLTTDGQRWWVEDLQSSNGTYVGAASGPLPTEPLPPGQRHELAEDDRIYLGAWTRLVVRRATPEEQNGSA